MNLESYLKKNRLNDEEKLLKYFEEVKNDLVSKDWVNQ